MVAPQLSRTQSAIVIIRLTLIIIVLQSLLWFGDRPGIVTAQQQTVSLLTTVSAASYERAVSPDAIVAGFGANLTTVIQAANSLPLPTILSNLTVEVNGRSASLLFISPGQINYLLPDDLVEGAGQVLVKRSGVIVAAGEIEIRAGAPGIFVANTEVDPPGPPAANLLRVRADNSRVEEPVAQFDGTKGRFVSRVIDLDAPNELVFLILYLTGTSKTPQPGDYRVLLGGSECRPEFMPYIGPAPGFAGLKQINLDLGGCVRKLREEDARANFNGIVSVALADIKNGQTSNIFELEFAPPTGNPPRITGLNKATVLAGEMLEIQGSGLAETTEVYMTDANGKRFNAQIVPPVTPTNVRVRVPFGAGTGSVTAATARGESTFPLEIRTSVSGVVQVAELQADGSYKRRGAKNVSIRLTFQNAPPGVQTNDDGLFQIADVTLAGGATMTTALMSVDPEPAGFPGIKRTEKMPIFAGRDNVFPGYLELKSATGPSIPTGPGGVLSNKVVRVPAAVRPGASEAAGQDQDVIFDPNGSTVRFPDGSTVSALTVTRLDPERVPADLPPGEFSSTIVQLSPIGGSLTPGGKLTFPNADGLPAGAAVTLYRYVQSGDGTETGQWKASGAAQVSADGMKVETGPRAVTESTYYFVSIPRPLTTVYGSVKEADGQAARAAQVQVRGQSGFALTDANGGFQLRKVPVVGAQMVIEVTYSRADGTVDRAERRGVVPRVGTTSISPPIVLPGQGQGSKPVILVPKSLIVEAGKTTVYTFLAYARLATATLQPVTVAGAPFASLTSLNNDRYVLRLAPGTGTAGNFTLTVTAIDSEGMRTEETIAVEVKAPVGNTPTAASQTVTTDEDRAVEITLTGSSGNRFRIVNAPQRGMLDGTPPNIVYTPNRDFNGTDNFSFVVGNESVESAPATVTIAVRPVGDAPKLEVGGAFTTNIGQLLKVVINGFDPDTGQMLTLTNTQLPAGAQIERTTGTSWLLSWRPEFSQIGSYSITLTLSDDETPAQSVSRVISIVIDAKWAQTAGPEGAFVTSFAEVGGSQFMGTLGGGVYRSTDNGNSWTHLDSLNIRVVEALTTTGTAVFAGSSESGIFRSTDNGNSWRQINNGLTNTNIIELLASGGTLYAGTQGGGAFRSTDNGEMWTAINNGLTDAVINTFAESGATLFAGAPGGAYRSTDNGGAWSRINNGLSQTNINDLVVANGAVLAATVGGGIFRSTDNGNNWVQVNSGLTNLVVLKLAASSGAVFAGTQGGGIFRSIDGGGNWVQINSGLTDLEIYGLLAGSGGIFAGTLNQGVFRSTNGGDGWTQINNGVTRSTQVTALLSSRHGVFAATPNNGVYRSADGGSSWDRVNHEFSNVGVLALAENDTAVFAGTSGGGVHRSLDGGVNWVRVSNGLTNNLVQALAVSGNSVFAGTFGDGVFRSTNNGGNWTPANTGMLRANVLALLPSGTTLYAASSNGGVYRSTDDGASWAQINQGLTNTDVQCLAVNGANLFAGTNGGGVFRSVDGGNNWTAASAGLTSMMINALVMKGTSVFAGTQGGVFRSSDNGNNWFQVNSGLATLDVRALTTRDNALLAGVAGDAVYRLAESESVWTESQTGLTTGFINAAVSAGQQIFIGTGGGGVFRSADIGQSWAPVIAGLPVAGDVRAFAVLGDNVYTGIRGAGVYSSSDQGANWTQRSNGLANLQVNALVADGTDLLAGTDGGVYRTTDNGLNWAAANNGLAQLRVLSLAATDSGLYAGTENGLFRSTNQGVSWTPVNQGLTNLYIVSLGMAPNGTTLLAGTSNGLFRSTNQGQNWAKVTNGISERVTTYTFVASGVKLLAGTAYGFYISEDNGVNWRVQSTGLLNLQVSAIAVQGNRVVAGTRSAGIFVSQLE